MLRMSNLMQELLKDLEPVEQVIVRLEWQYGMVYEELRECLIRNKGLIWFQGMQSAMFHEIVNRKHLENLVEELQEDNIIDLVDVVEESVDNSRKVAYV